MHKILLAITITAWLLPASQKGDRAEVQLQSAINKEVVEGDLKGAIDQYQKLAQGKDRAVAAKALVRMGQCYEKLGDAEARKAYERAVREFSDQTEAIATARARLAAMGNVASPTGPTTRIISSFRQDVTGHGGLLSPDGCCLLQHGANGELDVRDLSTGQIRHLTKSTWDHADFSRDGRQIAFARWANGVVEVRTVGADGAGERMLWRGEKGWARLSGWFPDNSRFLVEEWLGKDGPCRLVAVSTVDGPATTLREGGCLDDADLSPDGRFVVYSKRPRYDELWLFSLEDRREVPLLQNPAAMDYVTWTPDGKGILFISDVRAPGKTRDLWMLRMAGGRPQGRPELVKADMGDAVPLGMTTRDGAYYYRQSITMYELLMTEFDPAAGKAVGEPAPVSRQIGHSGDPSISHDGRWLSYFIWRPDTPQILVMQSLETGEEKIVSTGLTHPGISSTMSPDGRSLVVRHYLAGVRAGLHRMDANSGAMSLLKAGSGFGHHFDLSPDGQTLFFSRWKNEDSQWHLLAWEMKTGKERELLKSNGPRGPHGISFSLSRDGSQLAVERIGGKEVVIEIIPAAGGPGRKVYRMPDSEANLGVRFEPDGRHLLFAHVAKKGERVELQRIGVEGGQPQSIGIQAPAIGGFLFHPDGRRIFYVARSSKFEVWALENFLPKVAK